MSRYTCICSPKREELLILLNGYEAIYRFPDGSTKTAKDGTVVYLPTGSEYLVTFHRTVPEEEDACTVGVCYMLFYNGERVRLSDSIAFFECSEEIRALFGKELSLCKRADSVPAEKKAVFFRLFSAIGRKISCPSEALSKKVTIGNFETIRSSLDYMNAHYDSDISLEEIAALSYVSPVWFRKLFREKVGMSPAEYRTQLRMLQAERYINFGNMSVREIAESVGYHDVSLFIKHYKRYFGITPLAARKQKQSLS